MAIGLICLVFLQEKPIEKKEMLMCSEVSQITGKQDEEVEEENKSIILTEQLAPIQIENKEEK